MPVISHMCKGLLYTRIARDLKCVLKFVLNISLHPHCIFIRAASTLAGLRICTGLPEPSSLVNFFIYMCYMVSSNIFSADLFTCILSLLVEYKRCERVSLMILVQPLLRLMLRV